MRFAIKTRPEHTTWAQIRDVWVAADTIPLFESAWNWDHFYPLSGDLNGPNLETLDHARRAGPGHEADPARLPGDGHDLPSSGGAREHGGDRGHYCRRPSRAGAGRGLEPDGVRRLGIDLPPLKERFDRFDEGVEAIACLLSLETTTLAGRYVKLTNARCDPKPVQRPHPPITIGGRGRTRTLRTAARWAQQWNCLPDSLDEWRDLKQTLVAHCDRIGREPSEIICSVNVRIDPTWASSPPSRWLPPIVTPALTW